MTGKSLNRAAAQRSVKGWIAIRERGIEYPLVLPSLGRVNHNSIPWVPDEKCDHESSICTQKSCVENWIVRGWEICFDINASSKAFGEAVDQALPLSSE